MKKKNNLLLYTILLTNSLLLYPGNKHGKYVHQIEYSVF